MLIVSSVSDLPTVPKAGEGESPTPLPEAVPMEMVEGLRGTVSLLEQELGQARAELAGKEDINSILCEEGPMTLTVERGRGGGVG